jgi:hypothetical protein
MKTSNRNAGIIYRQTEQDKSHYYLEMEPLFAQGKIQILDHPELARELRLLLPHDRPARTRSPSETPTITGTCNAETDSNTAFNPDKSETLKWPTATLFFRASLNTSRSVFMFSAD